MKKIILTILMSLFTGVLGCFFYNTHFRKIPYGVILSILLIFFVALFIKQSYGRKLLALFSVIIIFLIFFFSNYGLWGDDIIIMGDTIGVIFTLCGTLIGPVLLLFKD